MRWTILGVWIIGVITVTSFTLFTKTSKSGQHEYYTTLISENNSIDGMTVYGKVVIDNETTLVPTSEGTVTKVFVRPGDTVTEGSVLATLDLNKVDLEQYENLNKIIMESGTITGINRSLKEITRLEKDGFYDAVEASKKRADIYSNLSQIINYRNQLQKLYNETQGKIVRAPFKGVVLDVRLKEGQLVAIRDDKNEIGITMTPWNSKTGVELEIGDEHLSKMAVGQKLKISVPLSHDQNFTGVVKTISRHIYDDKKKRYFKVFAEVDHKKNRNALASGMKVVVDVNTGKEDNLSWIPKSAFDIHLDDKIVTAHLSFLNNDERSIASTKSDDFKKKKEKVNVAEQSVATKIVSNELFPAESQITEIFLLTADNRVVKASVLKTRESGEMVGVYGTALHGMRVITHYRPKEVLW